MAFEKINEKTYMETLGNAFWLARQSKLHCEHYSICGFFSRVSEGVLLGQYKLIRNSNDMPLAFAVWAKVNNETLDKLLHSDHKITANEWNNGDNIFFLEFICPFKHIFQFNREVREVVPNKAKMYALRVKVVKDENNMYIAHRRTMALVNNLYKS
ncbi:toxin-activating lysine-acyltransferase [Candidatus Thiodubiliella endoseptemdiera]|uniref:RTX toxin-activating lysine-acyltransferase n=1 Tax=Candidatus Thiodubiliella endoseptemdiera TaxID=2738886 RepID=A0A853F3U7_9GAMM|nr:toxin-activating lysine-acyltransferase [Candidatus Thiodubiliella endoseptemdiera]